MSEEAAVVTDENQVEADEAMSAAADEAYANAQRRRRGEPEAEPAKPEVKTDAAEVKTEVQPEKQEEKPADATKTEDLKLAVAGLTDDEAKALLARIPKLEHEFESRTKKFDQFFSIVGNLQTAIREIKEGAKTPSAAKLSVMKGQLKKLSEEYPDIARLMEEDLAETTAAPAQTAPQPAQPAQTATPDLDSMVEERVAKRMEAIEERWLGRDHPDWQEVAKSNDFNLWIATLKPERQQEILKTSDASVFGQALTEFKDRQKGRTTARTTKQNRLEAAITPQGADDDASQDQLTADQAMEAAYKRKSAELRRL